MLQQEVRERFNRVPGIIFSIEEVGQIGGPQKPLNVNLKGDDLVVLKQLGSRLKDELYKVRGIVDIAMTLENDIPEYRLRVDRERALSAGVTTNDIVSVLGRLVGGEAVSTYEDEDGDVILQGEYNDIYSSISILNKLKGLNLDLVYADLTKTHFSYLISNPKRGEIIKKIMEYFLKNLKFKKDGKSSIKFSLDIDGGEDGIDIEIFDTSKVYITTGYDFMGSDIYRRSVFEIDDDFSKVPNKEEWISLINLVKDCIDYAKKNNIKI